MLIAILLALLTVSTVLWLSERRHSKDAHKSLYAATKQSGEYKAGYDRVHEHANELQKQRDKLELEFQQLQHQKISADVKLGQKLDQILPFLQEFPYRDDEIRGLFNPIDLIVFREDEVVFVEVKSGQSQLSEKQRQIRDNIKAGRVRFETHRMNEKGIKVK